MRAEAIIFDLDGTMWNALDSILLTWNRVVANHPECGRGEITPEEMGVCLGLPMTAIADRLFPSLSQKKQDELLAECCELENAYLAKHGGILYPYLKETLAALKNEYKLFVVSNCQKGYIESFIKAHGLEEYFDDIECWGNNLLPKGENNKVIMRRNNVTRAVYVGDTSGDEESARVAGIPFVFANYGFGEAISPDVVLSEFSRLPEVMEKVNQKGGNGLW